MGVARRKNGLRKAAAIGGILAVLVIAAILIGPHLGRRSSTGSRTAGLDLRGAARGFNVLLITLDTTVPSHLGCYGAAQARTPAIDSLTQRGVRFVDAVTSIPVTLPAHATILTGLYPPHHGVRDNGAFRLPEHKTTLAETLRAECYATAAFVGCFVLDERFGLAQGFDLYDFRASPAGFRESMPEFNERPADVVTDSAIRWLAQQATDASGAPFFAWVHYYDPHLPYESPLANLPEFAGRPYDAEITFVDGQVKRLLEVLDDHDLRRQTVIVLTTDHGEGFGQHDESTHGMLIYDSTVQAALVISCPALFDAARVVDDRVVGLVDIVPTVQNLLGITSGPEVDGVPLLSGRPDADRAIYVDSKMAYYCARWSPLYALRRHASKFILAPQPEYYQLSSDPGELRNLYDEAPPGMADLESALVEFVKRAESAPDAGLGARQMSEEEERRLGALGYVRGSAQPDDGALEDPKAMMALYNQLERAEALHLEGRNDEALSLVKQVAEQSASFTDAHRLLARIYRETGRLEEAAGVLRACSDRNPSVITLIELAGVLRDLRRFDAAEEAIAAADVLDPQNGRIAMMRGDCLAYQRRFLEAIEQYEEAIRIDANRVGLMAEDRIEKVRQWMSQAPGGN